MFNVGGPEILVIILVALIVLGPQQLPKAMRTFGNVMGEIRKVSSGFQAEMRSAMDTFTEDDTASARKDKPQSGTMATPEPKALAETMEQADVTEVVGRNPGPVDLAKDPDAPVDLGKDRSSDGPAPTEAAAEEPADGHLAVDPADRAAG